MNTVHAEETKAYDYTSSHDIHEGVVLGGEGLIDEESVEFIFGNSVINVSSR